MTDPGPPSVRGGRARACATAVLAGALLTTPGCTSHARSTPRATTPPFTTPAASPTPAPARVGVEVKQYREDEVAGVLQVSVISHDRRSVRVDRLALRSPDFAPLPPGAADLDLAPGQRTDLPVRFGAAECHGTVPLAAHPAAVLLRVGPTGEPGSEVTLALPTPNETLDRLLSGLCRREQVSRLLEVRYRGLREEAGGDTQRLTVALRYTGAGAGLTVTAVTGSVIFDLVALVPAGQAPAVLSARSRTGAFDVRVRTGRCDPHAFAESKKTYQWTVFLTLPGEAPTYLVAVPDPATRARLGAWALRRCGLG